MMNLGEYIASYRREHNYSVREFARLCGLSHVQIIRMESGLNSNGQTFIPTMKSLKAVAKGMGVKFEDVLYHCQNIEIKYDLSDTAYYKPDVEYIIERIKNATPEQLMKIKSYVDFVTKS
jgi:transcriptional regulator with XRE-family HTH domain